MDNDLHALSIGRLRAAWDAEVRPSQRRALTAVAFGVLVVAAHTARVGSLGARVIAAAVLSLLIVMLVVRAVVIRRRRDNLRHTVRQTIGRADVALGAATLRAMTLVERTAVDDRAGSPALASLHLRRLLGRVPQERLAAGAEQSSSRWATFGLGLAVIALGVVAIEPFRIIEGLDVLAARHQQAPMPLPWLDDVELLATPPAYLHQDSNIPLRFSPTTQARGTVLTVHGRPVRPGRHLVLTDGSAEVPFVDDGQGGVVAHWTLGETTTLHIAARFGQVRILQADEQRVISILDEAPRVTLEGAPRTVKLLDEPSIPLHYEITDDYGLREVDLVLRAGLKEERRVLSRPQADAKVDRGGYELKAQDRFFRRVYVPVEVRIEARDNDPIEGPKWGKSETIVVIPLQVGEPEALRYAALLKARDALTDLLADRMAQPPPTNDKRKDHTEHEAKVQTVAVNAVNAALGGDYGGLRISGRAASLIRGQLARLSKAVETERKATTRANHDALLEDTERVLLALDAGVRALGARDSQTVARRLADVADQVAAAAADKMTEGPNPDARMDAGVTVLDGGGKQLLKLGELGLDLGEIVANDLRRIDRARKALDWMHTELAARDLAARLRRPEPSFQGGGGQGGVESGGGGSPQIGEASSADQDVANLERDLEDLARDHANDVASVAEALRQAAAEDEMRELREEAKQRAEAIRDAVRNLPRSTGLPGSAESVASAARDQAEAMAGALEQGDLGDAVERGQSAMQSLKDAKRLGEQSRFFPDEHAGREAGNAQQPLSDGLAWAEEALRKLQRAASERARDALQQSSKNESALGDRARELRKRGEDSEGRMPEEMLDRLGDAEQAMRDAERALREGDGERGLERQREAQRMLEMAREPKDGEEEGSEGDTFSQDAEVPGKDKHKGPEAFRKRVIEGLGNSPDSRFKEALRRYAEGLLK